MRQTSVAMMALLAAIGNATAAETTDRMESPPDAHPECMQVNGPDCVLESPYQPRRVAAPAVTQLPPGVVVSPATIVAPASGAPIAGETEVTNVIMPPPAQRRSTGAQGK
jgi:hypothetical protein